MAVFLITNYDQFIASPPPPSSSSSSRQRSSEKPVDTNVDADAIVGSSTYVNAIKAQDISNQYETNVFNRLGVASGHSIGPTSLFTVFMPTDGAFASLPDRFVTCLLEKNEQVLVDFVSYHWVYRKVKSTNFLELKNIPTLLKRQPVIIELSYDGNVKINDSTVTTIDVGFGQVWTGLQQFFLKPRDLGLWYSPVHSMVLFISLIKY